MPKNENFDSWFNKNNKNTNNKHINRLKNYFKDTEMQFSENFDEFFKQGKEQFSKEEWEKLVKGLNFKKSSTPNMVIMHEHDYENLIEMRGLFKNTQRPEYVNTINKILGTLVPGDKNS